MRDFTLRKYAKLCNAIKENYKTMTVADYLLCNPKQAIILRHDVDVSPEKALQMAYLENKLGIKSTYYFRAIPRIFKPEVIKKIQNMGHEIGYHYEVLDKTDGDSKKAIEIFQRELEDFKKICDIKTICMHGNPLTPWDNRDLWKKYDFQDYGIIGEAYLSIDFNKIVYFTDTGRGWDEQYSLKDLVKTSSSPWKGIHSTEDLIDFIRKKKTGNICILTHPKRWNDELIPWTNELVFQSLKNIIKRSIKRKGK